MSATLTPVQAPAVTSPAAARPASASSRRKWYTLAVLCLAGDLMERLAESGRP